MHTHYLHLVIPIPYVRFRPLSGFSVFFYFPRHQSFVGNLKFAYGDASGKRGIVATEANVIASLNMKSGTCQRFCLDF